MINKPLIAGIVGFICGGLLVSIAATTFDKPQDAMTAPSQSASMHNVSMDATASELQGKTGDAFDKAFITGMISHHEGAVASASLSATHAKHPEVKKLSNDIIAAQQKEITTMRQWQMDWGYSASTGNDIHGTPPAQ